MKVEREPGNSPLPAGASDLATVGKGGVSVVMVERMARAAREEWTRQFAFKTPWEDLGDSERRAWIAMVCAGLATIADGCTPANAYAGCNFLRTGLLGSCRAAGGCLAEAAISKTETEG